MERDDEVKGSGNSYTTEFRQYDSRLGRWLTIDPIIKPWESTYAGYSNNPIFYIDPSGLNPHKGDNKDKSDEKNKSQTGNASDQVVDSKYSKSKNLIIYVRDASNKGFDAEHMADKGNGWDYVMVDKLEDAATWIEANYGKDGKKINNLLIRTHGSPSGIWLQTGPELNSDGSDFADFEVLSAGDIEAGISGNTKFLEPIEQNSVKAFERIGKHLDNNSNVALTACNLVEQSSDFAFAVSKLLFAGKSGTLYASRDYVKSGIGNYQYEENVKLNFKGNILSDPNEQDGGFLKVTKIWFMEEPLIDKSPLNIHLKSNGGFDPNSEMPKKRKKGS